MKGLKTQENDKFIRFFELVQQEASKQRAVFYADAGDGHSVITEQMECEDMMGWLIPTEKADEFEEQWRESKVSEDWSDYYVWAVWKIEDAAVQIAFESD